MKKMLKSRPRCEFTSFSNIKTLHLHLRVTHTAERNFITIMSHQVTNNNK